MTKRKINEFHVSFIKSLVFVALITIVSMVSVRFLLEKPYSNNHKTPIYTSQESQILSK
jgi:hypothetical protein